MNNEYNQFLILGGGINGLSCAMRLSDAFPNAVIQILAESFSPNTTSDIAAGLWGPYLLGQNDDQVCRYVIEPETPYPDEFCILILHILFIAGRGHRIHMTIFIVCGEGDKRLNVEYVWFPF